MLLISGRKFVIYIFIIFLYSTRVFAFASNECFQYLSGKLHYQLCDSQICDEQGNIITFDKIKEYPECVVLDLQGSLNESSLLPEEITSREYGELLALFRDQQQATICYPKKRFTNLTPFMNDIDPQKCLQRGQLLRCSCLRKYNIKQADRKKIKQWVAVAKITDIMAGRMSYSHNLKIFKRVTADKKDHQRDWCPLPKKCEKFDELSSILHEVSLKDFNKSAVRVLKVLAKHNVDSWDKVLKFTHRLDNAPTKFDEQSIDGLSKWAQEVIPEYKQYGTNLIRVDDEQNELQPFKKKIETLDRRYLEIAFATECQRLGKEINNLCTKGVDVVDVDVQNVLSDIKSKNADIDEKIMIEKARCEKMNYCYSAASNYGELCKSKKHSHGIRRFMEKMADLDITTDENSNKKVIADSGYLAGNNGEHLESKDVADTLADSFKQETQSVENDSTSVNSSSFRSTIPPQYSNRSMPVKNSSVQSRSASKATQTPKEQKLEQLQARIAELESKLKEKKIQQQTGKKEGNGELTGEIDRLLAELQKAKQDSQKVQQQLHEEQVANINNKQEQRESVMTPPIQQSIGSGSRMRDVNKEVESVKADPVGGIHHVADATNNKERIAVADTEESRKSGNTSSPLLTFKYQEFVKFDQSAIFNNNEWRSMEIIKYDEKGNKIIYVLRPVLNADGEFVEFKLVPKDQHTVAKKGIKKEEGKKTEVKQDQSLKDKARAIYEKLKGLSKKILGF